MGNPHSWGKSSHTPGSTVICATGIHILVHSSAFADEYKQFRNSSIGEMSSTLISTMDEEIGFGIQDNVGWLKYRSYSSTLHE